MNFIGLCGPVIIGPEVSPCSGGRVVIFTVWDFASSLVSAGFTQS